MTDLRSETASVVDRTRPIDVGGAVVAAYFLNDTPVFVLGEEALVFAPRESAPRKVTVHAGAVLATASDGERIITGGDDGKLVATDGAGSTSVIAVDAKRRWIDRVAAGCNQAVAWSVGKQAFARSGKGEERVCEIPSSVGGLAFAPKGFRLAVAHYNGVLLWFPNAQTAPQKLDWKGSHLAVTFSPDGRFLVTAMQEATLHGWRLADGKHMRMSGYAVRVTSLGWTLGGHWLATSGAAQLILWPFQGKDGPMGKQPRMLAPSEHRVTVVAGHPRQEIVAVGYADGMILFVRIEDGAEILGKKPGAAPVSALAWSADGGLFAFGTEDGEAGILDLG